MPEQIRRLGGHGIGRSETLIWEDDWGQWSPVERAGVMAPAEQGPVMLSNQIPPANPDDPFGVLSPYHLPTRIQAVEGATVWDAVNISWARSNPRCDPYGPGWLGQSHWTPDHMEYYFLRVLSYGPHGEPLTGAPGTLKVLTMVSADRVLINNPLPPVSGPETFPDAVFSGVERSMIGSAAEIILPGGGGWVLQVTGVPVFRCREDLESVETRNPAALDVVRRDVSRVTLGIARQLRQLTDIGFAPPPAFPEGPSHSPAVPVLDDAVDTL